MLKQASDITFKEFFDYCERRAYDGKWSMGVAIICIQVINEVLAVRPLFGRKKAREKKWEELKKVYFNTDIEFDISL